MRVKDLVKLLESFDPEAVVQTEGCDCIGPAEGVYAMDEGSYKTRKVTHTVVIGRNDRLDVEDL